MPKARAGYDLAPNPAITLLWSIYDRAINEFDKAVSLHYADRALADAERHDNVPVIADTLITKGSVLSFAGRWREGTGLLEVAQRLATAHGLAYAAVRAANNLAGALIETDPERAVQVGREGLAMARRYGLRGQVAGTLTNAIESSLALGQWDWIDAEVSSIRVEDLDLADRMNLLAGLVEIEAIRGRNVDEAVAELAEFAATSPDPIARSAIDVALSIVAAAEGRFEDSLALGYRAADTATLNEPGGLSLATSAAVRLGDLERARSALARLGGIGARGVALVADLARYGAAITALEGRWGEATVEYQEAWRQLRELRLTFSLARSQLEYVSVAPRGDPAVGSVAADARATFGSIGAVAYVRQLDQLLTTRDAATADTQPARSELPTAARTTAPSN